MPLAFRCGDTMRLLRYAMLSAVLAGCHFGNSAEKFAPAINPSGIWLSVDTAKGGTPVYGELLAIDSSGLRVLTDTLLTPVHLLEISYARIRWTRFHQVDFTFRQSTPPTSAQLARVRPLTRFPQGISDVMVRRLLAAYNIPAVETVR